MTVPNLIQAELAVYGPGDSSPFLTVPGTDILRAAIDERAGDRADTGSLTITNDDGAYSGTDRITSGDRAVFRTQLQGEASLSDRVTAMVRNVSDSLRGAETDRITLELSDFVFTLLQWRRVTNAFEDEDVGDIISDIVAAEASEIGRSQINTLGVTTDYTINGRTLFDAVTNDLAPVADALIAHDGTDLVVEQFPNISIKHNLTPADLRGTVQVSRSDRTIQNDVRVDGGVGHDVDDEQLTQSATQTVTESNRLIHQLEVRKSETARVDLYTQRDSNSSDSLRVRLQAERNGSPVDVDSLQSDIANRELGPDFIAQDGFTTFRMPGHTFAPGANPFLIVEASGATGHAVGTDGSGTPTYRADYPYPIIARKADQPSQSEYRRRDMRHRDDELETFTATDDRAASLIQAGPEVTVSGNADSTRAATLKPGEVVDLQGIPRADVGGRFAVVERRHDYESATLTVGLTLQDVDSL